MSEHPEQAKPTPGRYIVVPPSWKQLPAAGKAEPGAPASPPPVEIPHIRPDVIDLQASISRLCPPHPPVETAERAHTSRLTQTPHFTKRPQFTNRQVNPVRSRFHASEPKTEEGDQGYSLPPTGCPVIPAAQKTLDSAQALARALRKLHTSTSGCLECASAEWSEQESARREQGLVDEQAGITHPAGTTHLGVTTHPAGKSGHIQHDRQNTHLEPVRTRPNASARSVCPILREFNQQLETALQEVADEWHLAAPENQLATPKNHAV